jgi:hypothetical protein
LFVSIVLSDAATGVRLRAAHVRLLSAKGDTLVASANDEGEVIFQRGIRTDSLIFTVTHVGYKPLTHARAIKNLPTYLHVRIVEEALEMNAIIIRGDRIAMVLKGDTIIYNASSFKTMRGDPLEKLLEKLPGVEFQDGAYRVNGEPVHMILVNGTELFGRNTRAAGEMIRSDEVVNVKTYDYHTTAQRERGDTLPHQAERVLDVTTLEEKILMRDMIAQASAGGFTGNDKAIGDVSAHSSFFTEGRSRNWQAIVGENTHLGAPVQQETRRWSGSFSKSESRKKSPYDVNADVSGERQLNESKEAGAYAATSTVGERQTTSTSRTENNRITGQAHGRVNFLISKKVGMSLGLTGRYAHTGNEQSGSNTIETPSLRVSTDTRSRSTDSNGGGSVSVNLRVPFKLLPNVSFSLDHGEGKGSGWQVDTSAGSIERVWVDRSSDTCGQQYAFSASSRNFSWHKLHLSFRYEFNASRQLASQEGFDRLAGRADTLTTYDRVSSENANQFTVSGGVWRNNSHLSINLTGRTAGWKVDERSYPVYTLSKRYNKLLLQDVNFSYRTPTSDLMISYRENVYPMNPMDTREVVDRSNPLRVTVGNRSLKEGVARNFMIQYSKTFVKASTSLQSGINGTITSNQVAARKHFFDRDTFLVEYDYLMKAGTTLDKKENVDGQRSVNGYINFSKHVAFLESTIHTGLAYRHNRFPYFNLDRLEATRANTWSFSAGINASFSRFVQFSLQSTTTRERSSNGGNRLRAASETLSGNLRVNFAQRFWVQGNGSFYLYDSSMPGTFRRDVILDSSLSYKFGKNDRGEFGLHFNDILNRRRSTVATMTEDYAGVRTTGVLGRSARVFARYSF